MAILPIDPTNHPGDYIDHAQAIIRFLSSAVGELNPQHHFEPRELEGLCYILNHVEDNLTQAQSLLN